MIIPSGVFLCLTNQQLRMKKLSRSKKEFADALGISASAFKVWIRPYEDELKQMGVSKYAKVLPPKAVRLLCDKLGMEFED